MDGKTKLNVKKSCLTMIDSELLQEAQDKHEQYLKQPQPKPKPKSNKTRKKNTNRNKNKPNCKSRIKEWMEDKGKSWVWTLLFVGGIVMLTIGIFWLSTSTKWTMNGSKERCLLTDYRFEYCRYDCSDGWSGGGYCEGEEIVFQATVINKCDGIIFESESDDTLDCNNEPGTVQTYQESGFEIGNEYDCWIMSCDDPRFSLDDQT